MASPTLVVLMLLPLLSSLAKLPQIQAQGNRTSGWSLTAEDRSSSWKSPSGDFAFGFQMIGNEGFLLAIWFDMIPEKTVVWSANRNNLAPKGSKVELTNKGLDLADPRGARIWSQVMDNGSVSHASMLDSGNLVLADEAGSNVWGTFNQPTDTIVPTQVLDKGSEIVSRSSNTSYSRGRFALRMQTDGNLVMYTLPVVDTSNAYWATDTVGSGYRVIFNQIGQINLMHENGTLIRTVMSSAVSNEEYYQKAVLEYDGVFRQYYYPRNLDSGRVTPSWTPVTSRIPLNPVTSRIPLNICTRMNQLIGTGACGYNSYCILGDDQRPKCECPRGYSYADPSNEMNGCKRDFQPHSCEAGQKDASLFTIQDMFNVDWPLNDYERIENQTEDYCRWACLSDCNCDVAIFGLGYCWKKRMPLSNGRVNPSNGRKAFIKVRIANWTSDAGSNSNDKNVLILVGSVLLGSSVFVNFILMGVIGLGFFLIFRKKLIRDITDETATALDVNIRCFTYKELEDASNGFKEELGRGSFGIVFRGVIEMGKESNSRTEVAIKRLDRMFQECDREFKTEVLMIGQTHHKNLVRLLGYCNEGQNRLLVYEFLSNGTLASFLFRNDMKASWDHGFKKRPVAAVTAVT